MPSQLLRRRESVFFLKIWEDVFANDSSIRSIVHSPARDYTIIHYRTAYDISAGLLEMRGSVANFHQVLKTGCIVEEVWAISGSSGLFVDTYKVHKVLEMGPQAHSLVEQTSQVYPEDARIPLEALGFTLEELGIEVA